MCIRKAHAYGNDFLYVARATSVGGAALDALARELCDRHTGIGADGLIVYEPTPDGASMRLFNADGSRSEVSGNGVRGLAALLLRDDDRRSDVGCHDSDGGGRQAADAHRPRRIDVRRSGPRWACRADLRQVPMYGGGRVAPGRGHDVRQPAVRRAGSAARRAIGSGGWAPRSSGTRCFRSGTNVEFADVEAPGSRADPDLGAGRRTDAVVGHRIVRVADRGGGVRRRRARRRT